MVLFCCFLLILGWHVVCMTVFWDCACLRLCAGLLIVCGLVFSFDWYLLVCL